MKKGIAKRWSDSKGLRERRDYKSFESYEFQDKEHEFVFGLHLLSYMQGKARRPIL